MIRRWSLRTFFPGWLTLASLGCSASATREVACSPLSLKAVEVAHSEAAIAVVKSGKCDAYELVDDCPAYQAVGQYFEAGYQGWRICK